MNEWKIFIDVSEIIEMVANDELGEFVRDYAEDVATDIFVNLTAPPPGGTPVDQGEARNSWQLDLSNPDEPEVYSTSPYMNRLNDGHSQQSPKGFIEAAISKATRDRDTP